MADHTYRVTEVVGTSPESITQAIRNGIARTARTVRHLDWFEVTQVRGQIVDGEVAHFQVGLKIGFRIEDGHEVSAG
jgi:flavin-binding protein dodecin